MKKLFLLQGIFFQPFSGFGTRFDRDHPEIGFRVTVEPKVLYAMFAGVVDAEAQEGLLQDHYGNSELTDVLLTENTFSFKKRYVNREDSIAYEFKKEGNEWIGIFHGPDVGRGTAKCIITPTTEEFLVDPQMERLPAR